MAEAGKPVPEHDVALVLLQVSIEELPDVMVVGEALREAVGALPPIVIVFESVLLVLLDSVMRLASSTNTLIVCVPGEMV